MPVNVSAKLPAAKILKDEGIFVMHDEDAAHQDIRPLRIALLNIMPTKVETETQILRLLSNSPLQIEIVLLRPATHVSKNTSAQYLSVYYKTFDEVKDTRFDGLIITGAPVEQLPFEEVNYWDELKEIMHWSRRHVYSTLHICWGAQAGLYYHYGIPKYQLPEKLFGVFEHTVSNLSVPLVRGFDDKMFAPHSRHTGNLPEDIYAQDDLIVLCESPDAGIYLCMSKSGRQIFVAGHCEYDALTLKKEYDRDVEKGLPIAVPRNYFPDDDPSKEPVVRWRGHANLLFSNWLNYYVYQETPYDLSQLKEDTK